MRTKPHVGLTNVASSTSMKAFLTVVRASWTCFVLLSSTSLLKDTSSAYKKSTKKIIHNCSSLSDDINYKQSMHSTKQAHAWLVNIIMCFALYLCLDRFCRSIWLWDHGFAYIYIYEKSFEIYICLWQTSILLGWPCDRTLKSSSHWARKDNWLSGGEQWKPCALGDHHTQSNLDHLKDPTVFAGPHGLPSHCQRRYL